MIPIGDNVVGKRKPIVTCCLIGLNLGLFLWELKLELNGTLGDFISNWGLIPAKITTAWSEFFAGNPAALVFFFMSSTGIFTALFLHGSFSQILGNSIYLWVFGKSVEKGLGHLFFLGIYLFGGIFASIIQIWGEPNLNKPLIGANGAIASVIAAYVVRFPQAKVDSVLPLVIIFIPISLSGGFYLFWWFCQQIFYGIGSLNIPGVNPLSYGYWLHGTGMIFGGVFTWWKIRR
ncbi:rhomboid family intramembrane serine protease [Calothrix sp. NIES-3974]|uniref:rhomboid family intramembrane serine protease n=1 Tax=Calothrix sp. NIES-3974 TaxID=2005462 RepID=UPI000B605A6E|nr:rhomboid family intramembrane serine protease [Calothrix sp. NIES-3974]BAZ04850.1 hypothetical protein NIES3974_14930 [Calothrix sp. NIES-3974]